MSWWAPSGGRTIAISPSRPWPIGRTNRGWPSRKLPDRAVRAEIRPVGWVQPAGMAEACAGGLHPSYRDRPSPRRGPGLHLGLRQGIFGVEPGQLGREHVELRHLTRAVRPPRLLFDPLERVHLTFEESDAIGVSIYHDV